MENRHRIGILSDKNENGYRVVKLVSFDEISPDIMRDVVRCLPSNVRIARSKGWSGLFLRAYFMNTVIWKDENGTKSELCLPDGTITVKEYLKALGDLDCPDKKR